MRSAISLAALLTVCTSSGTAQPDYRNREALRFTAESRLVLVPVTVVDRKGGLVTGLAADAFRLTQDNIPQQITFFGRQDVPASIGIVLDTSGSMRQELGQARSTVRAFFDQCNPEDEAFLYTVSTRPDVNSGFTSDFGRLLERTVFLRAQGATALVDTIYAALRNSRSAHHSRRALLVISDGMDNHSRYSKSELMSAAVESDLQIYTISIFDPPRNKKPIELQGERQGVFFLEEISRRTGGLHILVQKGHDIQNAAATVGRAIRNQYVIGYVPGATAPDEEWHSIKVRMNLSGVTAYARPGFTGN